MNGAPYQGPGLNYRTTAPGGPDDPAQEAAEKRGDIIDAEVAHRMSATDDLVDVLMRDEGDWLRNKLESLLMIEPTHHDRGAAITFASFCRDARQHAEKLIRAEEEAKYDAQD